MDSTLITSKNDIPSEWLEIKDGKFICSECENDVEPQTMTTEGIVDANLDEIKSDLEEFSTKVMYAICPVCGMEYVFRLVEGDLYLEPSLEEK